MDERMLPFLAEYSKSNRALCRSCNAKIAKDVLRLGHMVQATNFDGKIPEWYHEDCFFKKPTSTNEDHTPMPASEWEIARFQHLRYDDQLKLRAIIGSLGSRPALSAEVSKDKEQNSNVSDLQCFDVSYATSSLTCLKCSRDILEHETHITKTVHVTSESVNHENYHAECFATFRTELGFTDKVESLPGWCSLMESDQAKLEKLVPPLEEDVVPTKKIKIESIDVGDASLEIEQERKIAEQQQAFYHLRDRLKVFNIDKSDLIWILNHNDQNVPSGIDSVLDRLCDIMIFGALERCSKCGGQFVFQESAYVCDGNLTEWSKCLNEEKVPPRKKTNIPPELLKKYIMFTEYPYDVTERVIRRMVKVPFQTGAISTKLTFTEHLPLDNMEFVIFGETFASEKLLTQKLQEKGGKVVQQITKHTAAIISNKEEVARMGSRMVEAKELKIPVVAENFIERIQTGCQSVSLLTSQAICDWGLVPQTPVASEAEGKTGPEKSTGVKSLPSRMKFQVKSGLIVDPDSGLADQTHVYRRNDIIYNCVLNNVDIQRGKNSFYKLQVLEADSKDKYWLFRAWGRIGTTVGGTKVQDFSTVDRAINSFHNLFYEKTCNMWQRHDSQYKKHVGKLYPIEIDYSQKDANLLVDERAVKSSLAPAVQDLVRMLFDVDTMNRVMLEFELDMDKIPLGKLSVRQLHSAMLVLTEISALIGEGGSHARFIDASNRFYSLVPHNFGLGAVKVLDTVQQVKEKQTMLESLMEIEFTYSLLNVCNVEDGKSMLDVHYEQLKTDIEPLERSSEEFVLLEQYVQNTHAATHTTYELEIEHIFRVKRKDEETRFQPFSKLHNRKLLWHGSRLTNFVGILTHGLKIAPPEAPVTGYMFGKGIYFADMVSKSANYCYTNSADPKGLMMLCEVALGDMQEYSQAHYVTKLPTGKHSVKGIGRTQPDPSASHVRSDGVEIPLGKGVTDEKVQSRLLYNEFIVYDMGQVNCQYLLKMNFKYIN